MPGATGDALEWAIALARSPAERTSLRQRELPDGMERLLQIAAGMSGDVLAEAVTQTGEDASSIVEAARFYAREILFHQGADAYRMLGLSRDASHDQIKAHHRFLQQWLHPDRHTSDWDAIFAARVNAAWNNLRNDERRRAYDDNPLPAQVPHASNQPNPALWTLRTTEMSPAADTGAQWKRRAPVLALLAVCAVLGLAVVRDQQNAAHRVAGEGEDRFATQAPAEIGLQLPEHGRTQVKRSVRQQQRIKPAQRPSSSKMTAVAGLPDPLENSFGRIAGKAAEAIPPVPRPREPVGPETKVASVTAAENPRVTRPDLQVAASIPSPQVATGATTGKAKRVEPAALVRKPNASVAAATGDAKAQSSSVSSLASTKASSAASASKIMRVQQVQRVGDRLIAFMSRPSAKVPPIWNSLAAQRGASKLRDDRQGDGAIVIATPPHWQVSDETAVMLADVVYPDGKRGRLAADLVWRGEHWLVSGLTLERDL